MVLRGSDWPFIVRQLEPLQDGENSLFKWDTTEWREKEKKKEAFQNVRKDEAAPGEPSQLASSSPYQQSTLDESKPCFWAQLASRKNQGSVTWSDERLVVQIVHPVGASPIFNCKHQTCFTFSFQPAGCLHSKGPLYHLLSQAFTRFCRFCLSVLNTSQASWRSSSMFVFVLKPRLIVWVSVRSCGILTTNGRCEVSCSGLIASCVPLEDYTVKILWVVLEISRDLMIVSWTTSLKASAVKPKYIISSEKKVKKNRKTEPRAWFHDVLLPLIYYF